MSSVPPPQAPEQPADAPPPPPELPLQARRWRLWMAPAAIGLGLGLGAVGASLVAGVGALAGGSSLAHPSPAVGIISNVVADAGFVLAAIFFTSRAGRLRPEDFGFRRFRLGKGIGAVALAALAYYLLTLVYAALLHLHDQDKLPSELGISHSTAALVGAALFVCVIAPVAEEFFFRGFLFGVLSQWRISRWGRNAGSWVAAVVVGILFGLAHTGSASPQYLIPLGFLGFVLCLVRWRTRSLYPCMALHSLNNSLALGVKLHWGLGLILALIVGALVVIGALTGPLSRGTALADAGTGSEIVPTSEGAAPAAPEGAGSTAAT